MQVPDLPDREKIKSDTLNPSNGKESPTCPTCPTEKQASPENIRADIRKHSCNATEILPKDYGNPTETQAIANGKPIETAWRWYLEFPDRDPVTVSFSPEATREEVAEAYPGAVAIVPYTPTIQPPDTLSAADEQKIRAWLDRIGESDMSICSVVLEGCQRDPEARRYFLARAGETQEDADPITMFDDDRRRCVHCLNLQINGVCKVATPGGQVSARRGYQPDTAILQRCAGYRPCPDDPDQRPGAERWPEYAGANT
ncbi:hypothetical protein AGMMS50256_29030 [Betaproteobacteria bacterium]|nr:hypothetical protein AGMMS50256_29030 [Betaproteobacteria bacterium]